ncbi:hypothetical protein [Actinocatenispora sera]|uniref:Uncharacterized protein n=1 Tax=Actinocatenispora sera TaxID=390989 RepID=A0A810KWR9_9ACTN|nr:hypothetical protein [Actinocatenispora sera]BCJ26789.1 hypothetical protein Asera_08970 [Actinocatenispora sera]
MREIASSAADSATVPALGGAMTPAMVHSGGLTPAVVHSGAMTPAVVHSGAGRVGSTASSSGGRYGWPSGWW